MKCIYISSYYQSKNNDYKLTDSEKDQIKEIISADQTLLVSYDTLDLAQKIMQEQPYQTEFSDYVTELCCDIEVAIQEKKIIEMATEFGFNHVLIQPSMGKPKIKYTEEFSINNLTLKETHDDNVYVINTHGKEQEFDGPYQQAIYNNFDCKRIVIDACSSASGTFPIKRSHNSSALEKVADEASRRFKRDEIKLKTLELIGYNIKFNTTESDLSACAIFAPRSVVEQEPNLKLITPDMYSNRLKELQIEAENKAIESKFRTFSVDSNDSNLENSPTEILKRSLIDICSKLTSHFIHKKTFEQAPKEIIKILGRYSESPDELNFKTEINTNIHSHSKNLSMFKDNLKKQRKQKFNQLQASALKDIAAEILQVIMPLKDTFNQDTNTSIRTLEKALHINKAELTDSSRSYSPFYLFFKESEDEEMISRASSESPPSLEQI